MLIRPLPVITLFIDALSRSLQEISPSARLTSRQKIGLSFIIAGILVTETLNWALFERRSLKQVKVSRLRWLFCSAKISWEHLLEASIKNILQEYGISEGVLSIDDTDKQRSKKTVKIPDAHKVKNKATGGYFNGQEMLFMILITDCVTFPVGFRFYTPDPELSQWRKKNKALKKEGIPSKQRPKRPAPNHERYPSKQALGLSLLREFVTSFPTLRIKGVLADALYGTQDFMDQAVKITHGAQIISQLRSNQCISTRKSKTSLKKYFARQTGVETHITIRGGKNKRVTLLAARLFVKAHDHKRRFVVALKYDNRVVYLK